VELSANFDKNKRGF